MKRASYLGAPKKLRLPPAIQELAARPLPPEPAGLPGTEQVRGMIASALHTADGKVGRGHKERPGREVWRVVQKVIDRREAWPRLARENAKMWVSQWRGGLVQ